MKEKTATQPDHCIVSETADSEAEASGPLRRCLVTRESMRRETMLRFVISPDAGLVFDVLATLPGRGMWLSASAVVIEQAIKRGAFARAARTSLRIPPDLRNGIEILLRRRVTELLGLARRSGLAVAGFEKGRERLRAGKAGVIVQAIDGSAAERARFAGATENTAVAVLSAAALGRIFGRDHVVHVAIAESRLGRMIEVEAARLAGVAGGPPSGQ